MITKTIGSGGDYATLYAAVKYLFDNQPLSDDWYITVEEDTVEITWATIAEIDFGGHTVTITAANHGGNHLVAKKIQLNSSMRVTLRPKNGTLDVSNLYFIQTAIYTSEYIVQLIPSMGGVSNFHHCFIDGQDKGSNGVSLFNNAGINRFYSNKIWDCSGNANVGLTIDYQCNAVVDNITIYNCNYGVYDGWNVTAPVLKNVVAFDCAAEDWDGTFGGKSQLINCADSDNQIAVEFTSTTDCIANIVSANEFKSLDDTSTDFLKLKDEAVGKLADSGIDPSYATTDIAGLAIPYEGNYPIGGNVSFIAKDIYFNDQGIDGSVVFGTDWWDERLNQESLETLDGDQLVTDSGPTICKGVLLIHGVSYTGGNTLRTYFKDTLYYQKESFTISAIPNVDLGMGLNTEVTCYLDGSLEGMFEFVAPGFFNLKIPYKFKR